MGEGCSRKKDLSKGKARISSPREVAGDRTCAGHTKRLEVSVLRTPIPPLALWPCKMTSLRSHLLLQAHLVAAFEQSLGNMTIRLQSLTMTAEQKVSPGGAIARFISAEGADFNIRLRPVEAECQE